MSVKNNKTSQYTFGNNPIDFYFKLTNSAAVIQRKYINTTFYFGRSIAIALHNTRLCA